MNGTAGVFTVDAQGLSGHTNYTFKAYATSALGTSYSAADTFDTLNSLPVAPNGTTRGRSGETQTVALTSLVTPTDADGDMLTLTNVTAVSGLTASFSGGDVTFTPNANFVDGSFTYSVSDGFGGTATGTISVTSADPVLTVLASKLSPVPGAGVKARRKAESSHRCWRTCFFITRWTCG